MIPLIIAATMATMTPISDADSYWGNGYPHPTERQDEASCHHAKFVIRDQHLDLHQTLVLPPSTCLLRDSFSASDFTGRKCLVAIQRGEWIVGDYIEESASDATGAGLSLCQ